jgi:hypothetical protein
MKMAKLIFMFSCIFLSLFLISSVLADECNSPEDCGAEYWTGYRVCTGEIDISGTKMMPQCNDPESEESMCSWSETELMPYETCPEKCREIGTGEAFCTLWGRPEVTINYPLETNYSENISQLNYTAFYDNYCGADDYCYSPPLNEFNCWYSTDNGATNSSSVNASEGINFTGISNVEGNNTWIVFCNITITSPFETLLYFDNQSIINFFIEPQSEPPVIPEEPTPEDNLSGNAIYDIMSSAGAGLGLFIVFMGQALPILLIIFGFVGIVVAIGFAIAKTITSQHKFTWGNENGL